MADSVIIADDHPIFRRGLREVLATDRRFELVGEAKDGRQALELIRRHQPRLAVVDIAMPELDGLDVIALARCEADAPRFCVLTLYDDHAYFRRAFELGAHGYLLKEHAEDEVLHCLQALSRDERFVGQGIAWNPMTFEGTATRSAPLSPAERRVLALVAESLSSREIAQRLNLSVRTVENHRAHIGEKLGLRGAHALLRYAVTHQRAIRSGEFD